MDSRKTSSGKSMGLKGHVGAFTQPSAGNTINSERYFKGHLSATLYDKAERIALALRIVTASVQDRCPVESINTRVVSILDDLLKSDIVRSETSLWRVAGHLRALVTDIEFLKFSGHIPTPIAALIIQAIDDIASLMHAASQGMSSNAIISESFFDARNSSRTLTRNVSSQPKEEGRSASISQGRGISSAVSRPVTEGSVGGGRSNVIHQGRRDRIIEILRSGPATVTEVAARMPDCGPKTVQRELASLVTERVIVAKGERRWRTYSIVSSID